MSWSDTTPEIEATIDAIVAHLKPKRPAVQIPDRGAMKGTIKALAEMGLLEVNIEPLVPPTPENPYPHVTINQMDADDDDPERWWVEGDLRAPGSGWSDNANYECGDALRPEFPHGVSVDCESSAFYAYCATEAVAHSVAAAVEAWLVARRAS